jgi:hypothetical protein
MRISRSAEVSLTCRSTDVSSFLPLGFTLVRIRGAVSDLIIDHAGRDLWPDRCRIAASGVPFYGRSAASRDAVPVVLAADGEEHLEAHTLVSRRAPAPGLTILAYPRSREITLALGFYRCLGRTLAVLPDPRPWPLLMPSDGRAVPLSFSLP